MSTRAQLLLGADFEGDEAFCDTVVNALKNHFRMSDPCSNMANRVPGEIVSDEDDDKLYHIIGESGYPCEEILQENLSADKTPIFTSVELGANNIRTSSKARAYLLNSQDDIVNGAWVTIQLANENYDPGNNFNVGTYTFVTPVAGIYHVDAGIQMHDCVAGQTYYGGIEYDGAIYTQKILVGTTTWHHFNLSDKIYCAAGKNIKLQVQHTDVGNTLDINGGSNFTYLAVHLLSLG